MERPRPAKVLETTQITGNISVVRLENALRAEPEPGQFIMVWNGCDEKPMAVTTIDGDELTITVKNVGPFTNALAHSRPGEVLGIRGPYGRGFDLSYESPVLVAGGIGASPVLFLSRRLMTLGRRLRLIVGFNTREDAIYVDQLSELGETTLCCVDGSMGSKGTVVDNLPHLDEFDCVYACGPERMLGGVGRRAERAGVACQLLIERYFKCGVGLCGSCALGRLVSCKDGPVFRWQELKNTEFGSMKRDACGLRQPLG